MTNSFRFGHLASCFALGLSLLTPNLAHAEGEIRIAEQFGIVYLLLNVARDQHLIEKYGKEEGIDIKVDWTQLSGGAAVNDALLSGSIDIAGAGVGPLLTIWDRTHGEQNVKAVASLGNFPYYLVSNNPKVKTIADFTEKDRIAVPAVGVSVQSRFCNTRRPSSGATRNSIASTSTRSTVPHPDATAALIAGGTEVTGHFSNPPFQEQAPDQPERARRAQFLRRTRRPNSPTVLFATEKFRQRQPEDLHGVRRRAGRSATTSLERQRRGGRYLHSGNEVQDRPRDPVEDHRQPAIRIQRHAEEYVSTGGVPVPRRCDQEQTGIVEGLLLSGCEAVAGELVRVEAFAGKPAPTVLRRTQI